MILWRREKEGFRSLVKTHRGIIMSLRDSSEGLTILITEMYARRLCGVKDRDRTTPFWHGGSVIEADVLSFTLMF